MVVMPCNQYGLSPFVSWQRSWKEHLCNKHTIIKSRVRRHSEFLVVKRPLHWGCWARFWLPLKAKGNHSILCLYYVILNILVSIALLLVYIEQIISIAKRMRNNVFWDQNSLADIDGSSSKGTLDQEPLGNVGCRICFEEIIFCIVFHFRRVSQWINPF